VCVRACYVHSTVSQSGLCEELNNCHLLEMIVS